MANSETRLTNILSPKEIMITVIMISLLIITLIKENLIVGALHLGMIHHTTNPDEVPSKHKTKSAMHLITRLWP